MASTIRVVVDYPLPKGRIDLTMTTQAIAGWLQGEGIPADCEHSILPIPPGDIGQRRLVEFRITGVPTRMRLAVIELLEMNRDYLFKHSPIRVS